MLVRCLLCEFAKISPGMANNFVSQNQNVYRDITPTTSLGGGLRYGHARKHAEFFIFDLKSKTDNISEL